MGFVVRANGDRRNEVSESAKCVIKKMASPNEFPQGLCCRRVGMSGVARNILGAHPIGIAIPLHEACIGEGADIRSDRCRKGSLASRGGSFAARIADRWFTRGQSARGEQRSWFSISTLEKRLASRNAPPPSAGRFRAIDANLSRQLARIRLVDGCAPLLLGNCS